MTRVTGLSSNDNSSAFAMDGFFQDIGKGLADVLGNTGASTLKSHLNLDPSKEDCGLSKSKKDSWIKAGLCCGCCAITTCACAIAAGITSLITCIAAPFIALFNLCCR